VCTQCGLVVDGLVDTGPERLLALRCEAIIVAAGNPRDAAESLWRVLGMLGAVMLQPVAAAVHSLTFARAGAWREE